MCCCCCTTGVPGDSGNPDFRVTQGTRSYGCVKWPGNRGESGKPEFWANQGTRSSKWFREHGILWVTLRNLSSRWLRELRVPDNPREPGVEGDYGNTDFRVNAGTRRSGWLRETGDPGDSWKQELRWLRKHGFPGDSENQEPGFGWLREPGVPVVSKKTDFRAFPGSRSSEWLREQGFPGDCRNPVFQVTPGTPGQAELRVTSVTRRSGWFREKEFYGRMGEIGILRATTGTRSSVWLRGHGGSDVSGHPELWDTPGTRISERFGEPGDRGDSGDPESSLWIWETWMLRETTGTRRSVLLWEHGIQSDFRNTELRVTLGTRSSGWLRETSTPVCC